MPPHKPNALPRSDLVSLQDDTCHASTLGEVEWRWGGSRNNNVLGVLPVTTSLTSSPLGEIHINANWLQPSEPRLTLKLADVPIVRWCVNGQHRRLPRQTHAHHYRLDGTESHVAIPHLLTLPHTPTVAAAAYRDALKAFCAYAHVQMQPGYWVDIPGRW